MKRLAILGCVALAGCQVTGAREAPAPPNPQDTCGKAQFGDLVGEPERNHAFEGAGGDVRIIYPNQPVTQDYRPDRLNVDVNQDGDIARLWCG